MHVWVNESYVLIYPFKNKVPRIFDSFWKETILQIYYLSALFIVNRKLLKRMPSIMLYLS